MAVAAADLVRLTRRARTVLLADPAIKTAFPRARDQANAPEPGFFESKADADAALALKAALTGTFRRRFALRIDGLVWIDPTAGIPTYTLVDAELGVNGPALVTRYELDLDNEQTLMEVIV